MKQGFKVSLALIGFLGACLIFLVIGNYLISKTSNEESKKQKSSSIFSSEASRKYETKFERKSREMGIVIGTPADDVTAIRGRPPYPTEVVGKDSNGLIIEWEYSDGIYVMRRWTIDGGTCYRVAEMKL